MPETVREFTDYQDFQVEYMPNSHRYAIHQKGERTPVVSVTGALSVLDKPFLRPWYEACGAEGAAMLAEMGELDGVEPREAINLVRLHKLGAEAKRDEGAARGTVVHDVLEVYHSKGITPRLGDFPAPLRGYVQGLCRWLLETEPRPLLTEQVVASPTHGYAGRFDLLAKIDGKTILCDLKTSPKARIYDAAHMQLAAYVRACEECGIERIDGTLIVAVGEDGQFTTQEGKAHPTDFLAVLGAHRACKALSGVLKAEERELAKAA